jgi:hypothetical protein
METKLLKNQATLHDALAQTEEIEKKSKALEDSHAPIVKQLTALSPDAIRENHKSNLPETQIAKAASPSNDPNDPTSHAPAPAAKPAKATAYPNEIKPHASTTEPSKAATQADEHDVEAPKSPKALANEATLYHLAHLHDRKQRINDILATYESRQKRTAAKIAECRKECEQIRAEMDKLLDRVVCEVEESRAMLTCEKERDVGYF